MKWIRRKTHEVTRNSRNLNKRSPGTRMLSQLSITMKTNQLVSRLPDLTKSKAKREPKPQELLHKISLVSVSSKMYLAAPWWSLSSSVKPVLIKLQRRS